MCALSLDQDHFYIYSGLETTLATQDMGLCKIEAG